MSTPGWLKNTEVVAQARPTGDETALLQIVIEIEKSRDWSMLWEMQNPLLAAAGHSLVEMPNVSLSDLMTETVH
jgi:hypothetical protein